MPKPIKVNYVHCFCERHKRVTEHIEYIMNDRTVKYKCRECYKERPHEYPLYGRKQPSINVERPKEQQWGRVVA